MTILNLSSLVECKTTFLLFSCKTFPTTCYPKELRVSLEHYGHAQFSVNASHLTFMKTNEANSLYETEHLTLKECSTRAELNHL